MHFLFMLIVIVALLPRALAITLLLLDAFGLLMLKAVGILILIFLLVFVYEEAIDKSNGALKFATAHISQTMCDPDAGYYHCQGKSYSKKLSSQETENLLQAYYSNKMSAEEKAQFRKDWLNGLIVLSNSNL